MFYKNKFLSFKAPVNPKVKKAAAAAEFPSYNNIKLKPAKNVN